MRGYPRGCGETQVKFSPAGWLKGLSPRVRGNPFANIGSAGRQGAIPAGAGKPGRDGVPRSGSRGYPRGCGETASLSCTCPTVRGLSPRVRGNPPLGNTPLVMTGAIPAGAGKPPSRHLSPPVQWGYPRGCGETASRAPPGDRPPGLSPRVRGNLGRPRHLRRRDGAIPAGAGKPISVLSAIPVCWGYPRGCGETIIQELGVASAAGLSPRVRGNQVVPTDNRSLAGAIPAGAGKPPPSVVMRALRSGYPRGCGETPRTDRDPNNAVGLSPRVRGNPAHAAPRRLPSRAIPAGAGKPARGA